MGLTGRASAARNSNFPPGSVGQPPNSGPTGGPECPWRGARDSRTSSRTSVPLCQVRHLRFQPWLPAVPPSAAAGCGPAREDRDVSSSRDNLPLGFFSPHLKPSLQLLEAACRSWGCSYSHRTGDAWTRGTTAPLLGLLMHCSGGIPKFPSSFSLWSCSSAHCIWKLRGCAVYPTRDVPRQPRAVGTVVG